MQPSPAWIRLAPSCLWLVLAACNPRQPPTSDAHLSNDAQVRWQGLLGCADCDGIQTQLVLQHGASRREFHITETYLAHDQGTRFEDRGHWRRRADLLELKGESGSVRVYALLPDGRLQPRDGHGTALSPQTDDTLQPMTAADDP